MALTFKIRGGGTGGKGFLGQEELSPHSARTTTSPYTWKRIR